MKDISYYKDKHYWYFRYGSTVIGQHNIDRIKSNIKELPNRVLRSKDLIYPERTKEFIKWMIKNADKTDEHLLDEAFTIMEGMEDGLSPQEAQDLVVFRNEFHKQLVNQYVLLWYKKGYEYYMETLPENIKLSNLRQKELEHIRMLNNLCKGMQRKLKI